MSGDDGLSTQERALLDAAAQQEGRVDSDAEADGDESYECEHCGEVFETLTASRSHECAEKRAAEAAQADLEEREGVVGTQVHEFGAHLCFADERDGMSPYYAVVSQFDAALHYDQPDEPFLDDAADKDWLLDTDRTRYWSGGIAAEGETYDTYNEYQIRLIADDELAEKEARKIQFQFRPALPDACTPDGERINSMPADLPEGIRVQINSANVHPDDLTSILRQLMDRIGVRPSYFIDEKLEPKGCNVYNAARYVRIERAVAEELITADGGILERLARFGSRDGGRGEHKWDHEDEQGHYEAVAMDPGTWDKLLEGREVGNRLKCYHMKQPEKQAGSTTSHPKLEIQFSQDYSDDLQYVPWNDEDYDVDDLLAELDETLVNCLHWAGVNLGADDAAYVPDVYFDAEAEPRDLAIVDDPIDLVEEVEADYAAQQLHAADLSPAQEDVLRVLADGGEMHYETVAEEADVGSSTVYRALRKVANLVRRANGKLAMEDDVIRERVNGLFQTIDKAAEWADREIANLADAASDLDEDSPFARWLERFGVRMRELGPMDAPVEGVPEEDYLELQVNLGQWTEDEIKQILREGGAAALDTRRDLLEQLVNTVVHWTDRNGKPRSLYAAGRFGDFVKVGGARVV